MERRSPEEPEEQAGWTFPPRQDGEDMPMVPDERTLESLEMERAPLEPAPAPPGLWSIG